MIWPDSTCSMSFKECSLLEMFAFVGHESCQIQSHEWGWWRIGHGLSIGERKKRCKAATTWAEGPDLVALWWHVTLRRYSLGARYAKRKSYDRRNAVPCKQRSHLLGK